MQSPRPTLWRLSRHHDGFTLVEMLVVIVVLGIAAVTLTQLSMRGSTASAQMLRDQQAQALADALLVEVMARPFTYCDPQDANVASALSVAGCAGLPEAIGPEAGETRFGATAATRFDNVNDFNGYTMSGAALRDAANGAITGILSQLGNCTASVAVQAVAMGGPGGISAASGDALRVRATVQCGPVASSSRFVAEAIRVRYAPNTVGY